MPVPAATTPNTIVLKADLGMGHREYECGGIITPGHLCEVNSDNEAVVHASAAGECSPMFAQEDALQGKTIDDNYAEGDHGFFHNAKIGDEIYALLTTTQTIAIGARLESTGDGTLRALSGDHAIVEAMEAVTTTDAVKRIRVRVLGSG